MNDRAEHQNTRTQVGPKIGIAGLPYAGAGYRTAWRKLRRGILSSLAGAWILARFASVNVWAQGMVLDICPTDYGSFPESAPTLTCGCSAAAVKTGTVWGTNPYYYQSSLCRAALHAGALGAEGGQVVIQPEKSTIFPAVSRNGVQASSTGQGMGFRVVVTKEPAAPNSPAASGTASLGAPAPAQSRSMTLDICPTDYGSFPEDAPPLTCGCSAAAVKTGTIWGPNPYYYQSALCRAALHAGAIGAEGGKIAVKPEKAAFFPSVNRNGVGAASSSEGMGFRVTAVPGAGPVAAPVPTVDSTGKPIQAPIAATLRATGRVQLYINFATDQARPLPSSEPVLQELLATLQQDTALRVELIGHTDTQGSAPYNLDLSQRRAAAVYLWLIQHGVESGRLRSDGRGLMEPIADNTTESGRALNRRVEVKSRN
jgi:outer membrane protein OmpA-like peptidoglycan-associated protein